MDLKMDENDLIGEIYDAAVDPERWWQLLRKMRNLFDAEHCNLIFYDIAHPGRNKIYFGGYYSEEITSRYYSDLIHADYKNMGRLLVNAADGEFVGRHYDESSESDRRLKKFLTEDLSQGPTAGARLFNLNYTSAYFSVIRFEGRENFCADTTVLLQHIASHLCRAMRIHHQLQTTRHEQKQLEAVLENTAAGGSAFGYHRRSGILQSRSRAYSRISSRVAYRSRQSFAGGIATRPYRAGEADL